VKRVAILISGGGSNMLALVRDMAGDHPARPVLVASNDPAAGGLPKAAALGIPTAAVDHRPFGRDREAFEAELARQIDAARPDIICLAGFMRILTPASSPSMRGGC
jgi:phosphoribosylglycinamide formyltransferase 1